MYNEEEFVEENIFNSKINEFIEEEISNRVSDIKIQLENSEKELIKTKKKLNKLENENEELKKIQSQIEMFKIFKGLVNKNNFSNFTSYLNLKSNGFGISGMDSETIPDWFKLLFRYYEDREKLFVLMDMFNIEYPIWAKDFKMPYDYNEEELLLFINSKHDKYITNGCIFEGNTGFFWRNVRANSGKTKDIINSKSSFEQAIPWQLILSNPLWLNENMFLKIIDVIKNKKYSFGNYFYAIQDYIKISDEQIKEMAKLLPKDRLFDVHKKFIGTNKDIFKIVPNLAKGYFDKINDNQYSTFYYLNFPVKKQIEFIKNYNGGIHSKFDLVKKMDISKEEKVKLITEIAGIEIEKVS